jgi:hypothetical protein
MEARRQAGNSTPWTVQRRRGAGRKCLAYGSAHHVAVRQRPNNIPIAQRKTLHALKFSENWMQAPRHSGWGASVLAPAAVHNAAGRDPSSSATRHGWWFERQYGARHASAPQVVGGPHLLAGHRHRHAAQRVDLDVGALCRSNGTPAAVTHGRARCAPRRNAARGYGGEADCRATPMARGAAAFEVPRRSCRNRDSVERQPPARHCARNMGICSKRCLFCRLAAPEQEAAHQSCGDGNQSDLRAGADASVDLALSA